MTAPRAAVLLLAALLVGVPAGIVTPDAAYAQEGRGGEKPKDEEKEKTPEEKELEAIGKDFEEKDVAALVARIPEETSDGKKGKVRLKVGAKDGTYTREQAKGILEDWLDKRTITRVKLKSAKDLRGTFVLKWRKRAKDEEVEATLTVRIAKGDGDAFVLKELGVQRR